MKSTPGSFLDVQAQTEKQTEGSGLPGPSQLRQDENEKVRTAFLSQILFYFLNLFALKTPEALNAGSSECTQVHTHALCFGGLLTKT